MKADPVTRLSDCDEGPQAFERFDATMGTLLSVPKEELQRRMEAYKEEAARNPRKRGPKPKVKKRVRRSASRASART